MVLFEDRLFVRLHMCMCTWAWSVTEVDNKHRPHRVTAVTIGTSKL